MDRFRCCFEKVYVAFTEIDVSNRFSLTVAVPKNTISQNKIKAVSTLKEQLFGESSCSESHPCKCKCLQLFY